MESAKSLSDLSVAEDAIRCKLQAVSDMEETEREIYKKVREESSWELQGGEEEGREGEGTRERDTRNSTG